MFQGCCRLNARTVKQQPKRIADRSEVKQSSYSESRGPLEAFFDVGVAWECAQESKPKRSKP